MPVLSIFRFNLVSLVSINQDVLSPLPFDIQSYSNMIEAFLSHLEKISSRARWQILIFFHFNPKNFLKAFTGRVEKCNFVNWIKLAFHASVLCSIP
jgi:hypothetical protein